jgi:hypothetical protein
MNSLSNLFRFASLFFLALSAPSLLADEENLIKNSALEGDPMPYEWSLADTGDLSPGEVAQDKDAGQEGASCLRITHPPGGGYYTQIRQIVPVSPRTKYILRAKVKTENLLRSRNGMPALFGMTNSGGSWIGAEHLDTFGEWKDVEISCETPDVDTVLILIYLDVLEGSFWVEDVSLVPAPVE